MNTFQSVEVFCEAGFLSLLLLCFDTANGGTKICGLRVLISSSPLFRIDGCSKATSRVLHTYGSTWTDNAWKRDVIF